VQGELWVISIRCIGTSGSAHHVLRLVLEMAAGQGPTTGKCLHVQDILLPQSGWNEMATIAAQAALDKFG
jgi:hypothetical protein